MLNRNQARASSRFNAAARPSRPNTLVQTQRGLIPDPCAGATGARHSPRQSTRSQAPPSASCRAPPYAAMPEQRTANRTDDPCFRNRKPTRNASDFMAEKVHQRSRPTSVEVHSWKTLAVHICEAPANKTFARVAAMKVCPTALATPYPASHSDLEGSLVRHERISPLGPFLLQHKSGAATTDSAPSHAPKMSVRLPERDLYSPRLPSSR